MYQNGYNHELAPQRPSLPPGAMPPAARLRTTSNQSSRSSQSDEFPTPIAVNAPSLPAPPMSHQAIQDSLFAEIEQDLQGFGLKKQRSNPRLLDTSRDSLYGNNSNETTSTTGSNVLSMYGNGSESQGLLEQPFVPPARSSSANVSPSSASPSSPSASAHRITAMGYSPTISPGSIRRAGARPLPQVPQAPRVPSSNTRPPLASLTEGAEVDGQWAQPLAGPSHGSIYTPPSTASSMHGSPSSVSRLSVDSARKSSVDTVNSMPWYSPGSPAPEPFDPITGKVARKTSYGMAPAIHSPTSDDERTYRYHPSPPSTTSSSYQASRADSVGTLGPRTSVSRAALTRNLTRREEPVPPHLNPAFLSHLAMFVKDRVPRAEHTRGAVPYNNSFTGQDVVNTVQRALPDQYKANRRMGLQIARSLHGQLFFFDVRDNTGVLQDNLDGVYTFLDEEGLSHDLGEGSSSSHRILSVPLEELPTGVVTETTSCYSPFCNRITALGHSGGCYSSSCPNNATVRSANDFCPNLLTSAQSTLKRQTSTASEKSQTPSSQAPSDMPWAATVSSELLSLIGETEVKRQNEIHELISGEQEYIRDLDILRTDFLEAITEADPQIIPSDEQSTFFAEVLLNAFEVREHAAAFSDALQMRQREQGPVIQSIGDIVLSYATDWSSAYLQYMSDFPFADARVKREQAINPAFAAFMDSFSRRPATRRLAMNHYHLRISVRLQRYLLPLEGIYKRTPEENTDRHALKQAIALLKEQCKEADQAVAASELKLECRNYERDLVDRPGSSYIREMELSHDERNIVHRGRMLRKPESSSFTDWTELFVILLDNYLIMTKPRAQGRSGETRYHISKRPVPLELLTISNYDDPPVPRSSGFHLPRSNAEASAPRDDRSLWPITLQYSGREGGSFALFAESSRARDDWRNKLRDAISTRTGFLKKRRVMECVPLCQDAFFTRQNAHEAPVLRDGIRSIGRPTCSVAFQTPEGHQLVAIGHEDGLWIGLRQDPTSFRLVLHMKCVTQCAVLQDFALILVLANKTLYAYPLEALVPSAASSVMQREKEPQRISGTKDVLFFRAGKVGPRLLVIYVKRSGVQTVFKALEPIASTDRSRATLLRRRPDWFRTYKEFFLPSETYSIIFLRTQLSIVCAKGFELLSLEAEPLKMTSFPDWPLIARNDARASEVAKRCSDSKAIAMFRLDESEFLFVYEDLAIYADKHGDPVPSRYDDLIDWHGRPRHVVFMRPFLVAFDLSFVEIRHAHTGKLVQIIKDRDVHCTFEGLGGVGYGTGESERRPHLTSQQNGRHIVSELVSVDSRGA